ncbi:MAG TPA: hypothetical protein VFE47_03290 [Tepidisphaeraceae bacterium]|jgi:hypothetical protein|nr:hypothetical protein [Tepidisphaeraceae bacterium]
MSQNTDREPFSFFKGRSVHSILHRIEALLGLILACFIGLGIGIGGPVIVASGLLYDRPPLPIWKAIAYSLGWLVLVYFEYRTVLIFGDALEGEAEPVSVHAALGLSRRGLFTRPFVAIWWLGQGIAIIWAGDRLVGYFNISDRSTAEAFYQHAVQIAVILASAFASNMFFLCFLAVLIGNEWLVRTFWRCRIIMDIVITWSVILR